MALQANSVMPQFSCFEATTVCLLRLGLPQTYKKSLLVNNWTFAEEDFSKTFRIFFQKSVTRLCCQWSCWSPLFPSKPSLRAGLFLTGRHTFTAEIFLWKFPAQSIVTGDMPQKLNNKSKMIWEREREREKEREHDHGIGTSRKDMDRI